MLANMSPADVTAPYCLSFDEAPFEHRPPRIYRHRAD